jgi:hypothetical protein
MAAGSTLWIARRKPAEPAWLQHESLNSDYKERADVSFQLWSPAGSAGSFWVKSRFLNHRSIGEGCVYFFRVGSHL